MIVGRHQLALLMGVKPNMISRLLPEGLPAISAGEKGKESRYDAVDVLAWWRARQKEREDSARDRYFRLQGDKLELEVRARTGELVETGVVEDRWSALVVSARERMLSLPPTALQRGIVVEEKESELIDLVDEVLNELSNPGEGPSSKPKKSKKRRR